LFLREIFDSKNESGDLKISGFSSFSDPTGLSRLFRLFGLFGSSGLFKEVDSKSESGGLKVSGKVYLVSFVHLVSLVCVVKKAD